jgi:hypothetical protein
MPGLPMERSLVEVVPWENGPDAASEMSLSQLASFPIRAEYKGQVLEKEFSLDNGSRGRREVCCPNSTLPAGAEVCSSAVSIDEDNGICRADNGVALSRPDDLCRLGTATAGDA